MTLTITHHPAGTGHPYAEAPDQRSPVHPLAGQPAVVAAVVSTDADRVWYELIRAGAAPMIVEASRADESRLRGHAAAAAGGDGHLAEAQAAAGATDGTTWEATLTGLDWGVDYRYRMVAQAGDLRAESGWHTFSPARWVPAEEFPEGHLTIRSTAPGGLAPTNVEWLTDGTSAIRVRFALPLTAAEHVVGFGERYDAVDQRGRTPDSVVFEQYKAQAAHRRTYFPMPFAHVTGGDGWGFHVNTSRRVWFDVAATTDALVVEAMVGSDAELTVDLYGGDPVTVLRSFLDQVGRAETLPEWVHRLWASGNEWNTQDLVMAQMDAHRDEDVPVGVVVIEAWSDEEGITIFRDARYDVHADGAPHTGGDFDYPADGAWPDPRGMIDELHRRGVKVVLWQIPLLKSEDTFTIEHQAHGQQVIADGQAMVDAGFAIQEEDGTPYHNRGWWFPRALMPDLSTPAGRDWWAERRRYLVTDLDVDGFKTDGGEHAWGDELRYGDGTRGDVSNNLNPVRYAQTYGDLLRSVGKPPITFSRAGFTGSQAHGLFWAGDEDSTWAAFQASVRAGITAAACGVVYWGWDFAGFSGPLPSPELYLRSAAASVFMPIMQYHSEFNHHRPPLRDRTPWNVAGQWEDDAVIGDLRRLVQLRERLVGYIAEQARTTIGTDRPLMRALFFDHADDPRIWDHPLQYAFGDALIVHPVTEEGATVWDTYLPAGRWVDVWTGAEHAGGTVVTRDVSDRTVVPVYCRAEDWPELRSVFE